MTVKRAAPVAGLMSTLSPSGEIVRAPMSGCGTAARSACGVGRRALERASAISRFLRHARVARARSALTRATALGDTESALRYETDARRRPDGHPANAPLRPRQPPAHAGTRAARRRRRDRGRSRGRRAGAARSAQRERCFGAMLPKLAGSGKPVFVRVNNVRGRLTRDDVMAVVRPGLAGVVHPKTGCAAGSARPRRAAARSRDEAQGAAGRYRHDPADREPAGGAALRADRDGVRPRRRAVAGRRRLHRRAGREARCRRRGAGAPAPASSRRSRRRTACSRSIRRTRTSRTSADSSPKRSWRRRSGSRASTSSIPDQAAAVNAVFTPSKDEVAYARRVVAAAAQAAKQRRGSIALDGRMIDAPVVERARSADRARAADQRASSALEARSRTAREARMRVRALCQRSATRAERSASPSRWRTAGRAGA